MGLTLNHFLVLGAILFGIGLYGAIVAAMSWRFMVGVRYSITSQILSLLASLSELTLMIFVPIILCTPCPIGCFLLQHMGEHFGKCVR